MISRPASRTLLTLCGGLAVVGGLLLWRIVPALDQRLFESLRLAAGSPSTQPLTVFTAMGSFSVLGPLALVVVGYLALRGRHHQALWLLATITGGRLAVEALKLLFVKPRPPLSSRLAEVTSYSFPSSHSAGSMMTWLALAMLFTIGNRRPLLPAIGIACAIGWSRIALGVHWPSDVVAGLGFGMLWVGLSARWLPRS